MNKLKILTAACLSCAASTGVVALESSVDWGPSSIGEQLEHYHLYYQYNVQVCTANCQALSGEDGWAQVVKRVPDNAPSAAETLNCTSVDSSGNPIAGQTTDRPDRLLALFHAEDVFGPGVDGTLDIQGNVSPNIGLRSLDSDCELHTDELGKIVGGWTQSVATVEGDVFTSTVDWDTKSQYSLQCSNQPDITDIRAMDVNAIAGGDNTTLPSGCTALDGALDIYYFTCDVDTECGQFGKSVPVPAFAAAALGMGLVGLTVLSSRRRQVK